MSECIPCKALAQCLQFADFEPSSTTEQSFVSPAQAVTVECPNGSNVTVTLEGGIASYVVTFQLGQPPYPNLTLNCIGGTISIPVPDDTTQTGLVTLVNQLLTQCMQQIAISIGCAGGNFSNTQQSIAPCQGAAPGIQLDGALPAGVSIVQNGDFFSLVMSAGSVTSTESIADANAKAITVLNEIFSTGNVSCQGGS